MTMSLRKETPSRLRTALMAGLVLLSLSGCSMGRVLATKKVVDLPADALLNFPIEDDEAVPTNETIRMRRDLDVMVTKLEDLFPRAIIHWSGAGSQTIFVVTQAFGSNVVKESHVYRTRDYGQTWDKETDKFGNAIITNYFPSPHNKDHILFVDWTNNQILLTEDEGDTYTTYKVPFTPSEISYSEQEGILLARDYNTGSVYSSRSYGKTWSSALGDSVGDHTVINLHWGIQGVADDKHHTLYLEVQQANKLSRLVKVTDVALSDSPKTTEVPNAVNIIPDSFILADKFMFYQVSSSHGRDLYVSYNRGDFSRASFKGPEDTYDFAVLDAAEDQAFVAVKHGDSANLYISDAQGSNFALSLANLLTKPYGPSFQTAIIDFQRVDGIKGIYVASRQTPSKGIQSVMSYDKGGEWNLLPPPAEEADECTFPGCSLNLHMQYSASERGLGFEPLLSLPSAPGYVLGNGNLGSSLTNRPSMFVSRDAGMTWGHALDDDQQYNLLDHGGILVATDPYNARDKGTTSIRYSIDEGATWKEYNIPTPLHFVAVLTEPNEKSTVLSIWGYPTTAPMVWTTVRVDFAPVLGNGAPCVVPDDYTSWSPRDVRSPVGCLMGSRDVYTRRKQFAQCVNGYNFDRPVNSTACECVVEDFECEYGFERADIGSVCLPVSVEDVIPACSPGKTVSVSKGYRKISGDVCTGGVEVLMQPMTYTCPDMCPMSEWSEWSVCDPCSIHKEQFRTRTPLNANQDLTSCPCTVEQRPCDAPSLAGALQVLPQAARAKLGSTLTLTAVLRNGQCGGVVSDSVFGDVSFAWAIPATLKYSLADGSSLATQVLTGVSVNTPGIFRVAVTASNAKDSATIDASVVVYESDQWYLINFATSTGGNLNNVTLESIKTLFPAKYAASSKYINAEQIVETLASYTSNGKLYVRFQLLSLGGSETFYANVKSEMTTLANSAAIDIAVGQGITIRPIPGTAHQIDAPDGYAPLQPHPDDKSTAGSGSNSAAKALVPIVITFVIVIIAGVLYFIHLKKMRRRYRRVGGGEEEEEDGEDRDGVSDAQPIVGAGAASPKAQRAAAPVQSFAQMQEMGEFDEDDHMINA